MATLKEVQEDFAQKDRALDNVIQRLKETLRDTGPVSLGDAFNVPPYVHTVVILCNELREADAARTEAARVAIEKRTDRNEAKMQAAAETLKCPCCNKNYSNNNTLRTHLASEKCGWRHKLQWRFATIQQMITHAVQATERRRREYADYRQRKAGVNVPNRKGL